MLTEVQGNSRLENRTRQGRFQKKGSQHGPVAGEVDRSLAYLFVKAPIGKDRWRYPATAADAARGPTAAQVSVTEDSGPDISPFEERVVLIGP